MRMEAGLDTGPMLAAREVEIGANDTAKTLHDRLARLVPSSSSKRCMRRGGAVSARCLSPPMASHTPRKINKARH